MKNFFYKLEKITKFLIIAAPIVILFFLIKKDLVLSGDVEFVYDFSRPTPAITELFPANRASEVYKFKDYNTYFQSLLSEPVYFEARLPQTFDRAEVEIVYQNPSKSLIQLGLRTLGEGDWSYAFKPLDQPLLNNLDWSLIQEEIGTLWQRNKRYLNLSSFLNEIDLVSGLAGLNYPLSRQFKIDDYRPDNKLRVYNAAIRGQHSFYTYVKNEDLNFSFIIQDINRSEGPDPLIIALFNNDNEQIDFLKAADDGVVDNKSGASVKKEIIFKKSGLPEGVYRIELKADDDIFFRNIATTQRYLTFINRLYLVDNPEYSDGFLDLLYQPSIVYSTIPRLGFETSHPQGLQTIGLGENQSLSLADTHKNYFITPTALPTYIIVPKNDVKIFGRGLMALSQESYFNPEIYELSDAALTPDINYLISDYQIPQAQGVWQKNTVKFDLKNAATVNRKLRFMVSAPELKDEGNFVAISKISVRLIKDKPLTSREIFQKIIKYIKNKL